MAAKPFISATLNPAQVQKATFLLLGIKNGSDRAMTRALNATASKARTRVVKDVRADVRLTAGYVRDRVKGPAQSFKNKASFSKQEARVSTPNRPLILAHYVDNKATVELQEGRGGRFIPVIAVKVKTGGSKKNIEQAFYLRLKQGEQSGDKFGIFVRRNGRLVHLYGPSVSQVFSVENELIVPDMNEELAEQMDRQVEGILRQYG